MSYMYQSCPVVKMGMHRSFLEMKYRLNRRRDQANFVSRSNLRTRSPTYLSFFALVVVSVSKSEQLT